MLQPQQVDNEDAKKRDSVNETTTKPLLKAQMKPSNVTNTTVPMNPSTTIQHLLSVDVKDEKPTETDNETVAKPLLKAQITQSNITNTSLSKNPVTTYQNHQVETLKPETNVIKAVAKPSGTQTEAAKIKETILNWCKENTEGYQNVSITNFSSSWNNGMAFCALVHHFCPDAFDFDKLDPKNRKGNFELAFKVAEDKCQIAPLLEAEDMILMGNKPDARCVFTYLSTFYQILELKPKAKAAAALAKKNES